MGNKNFQGTLCFRIIISEPRLPDAFMGSPSDPSRNSTQFALHLKVSPTVIFCGALPKPYGLQHNHICSTSMKYNYKQKADTKANMGTP